MFSSCVIFKSPGLLRNFQNACKSMEFTKVVTCPNKADAVRRYGIKHGKGCRVAPVDKPNERDEKCCLVCDTRMKKKPGVLHRIKMQFIDGGTNFGTPFKRLMLREPPICIEESEKLEQEKKPKKQETTALIAPKEEPVDVAESSQGIQVAILGADSTVGQYVALLLKQCDCIKKLRLYQACSPCPPLSKDVYQIAQDLKCIDSNCAVQGFTCQNYELDLCLQNSDIVVMLDCAYAKSNMPLEERFLYQAPLVKQYADSIAHECPRAFVIVCTSPVDCMVPLVAETFKETGWYDRRKLLGSIAAPEMRASTLVARALALDPSITRVPCVGGTEGEALVPLFSKAIEHFDFPKHNVIMMTDNVRQSQSTTANPDLSEAHSIANLVKDVALALQCLAIPRVSGFVETDMSQTWSPARYLCLDLLLNRRGVCKVFDFPRCSDLELELIDSMWDQVMYRVQFSCDWYKKRHFQEVLNSGAGCRMNWTTPMHTDCSVKKKSSN